MSKDDYVDKKFDDSLKRGETIALPQSDEEKLVPNYWLNLVKFKNQKFWHLSFNGTGMPGIVFKSFCGDVGHQIDTGTVHEMRISDELICRECKEKYLGLRGLTESMELPAVEVDPRLTNIIDLKKEVERRNKAGGMTQAKQLSLFQRNKK